MTDGANQKGKKKNDLRALTLRMAPPVPIQLEGQPAWIAQSMGTRATERHCTKIDENEEPAEVARKFVSGLVRERPNDELKQAALNDLPPLPAELVRNLTDDELSEIARQYLAGSTTQSESELDPAAQPLDQLKAVLLANAKAAYGRSKKLLDQIKNSTSLNSLFGSSAIADLLKTQTSISAMQEHARDFQVYPDHKYELPKLPPIETTGRDMLSALQDLAKSSNEQLPLLNSQREQQALQSETLANMNTSLVALAEGTASQAAKAKWNALWALIVAAASFAITAGGVFLNHSQSKLETELQTRAMNTDAKSAGALLQLIETSVDQQSAALDQAASSQAQNEADNQELRLLLRELLELQRQQQEESTAD